MDGGGIVEQRRETVGSVNSRVGYVHKISMKRKKKMVMKKETKKVRKQNATAIQELFDSCKLVFKGPGNVPSPPDVRSLCRILGMYNWLTNKLYICIY